MRRPGFRARPLLVAGTLAVVFGTPLRASWARAEAPWWGVFALWACAIAVLFACSRRTAPPARTSRPEPER